MDQYRMLEAVRRYVQAGNDGDLHGLLGLLHKEMAFSYICGEQVVLSVSGAIEYCRLVTQIHNMYLYRRQKIRSYRFDEDAVWVEFEYRGKLAVDIPAGPRAGEIITGSSLSKFVFGKEKIIRLLTRTAQSKAQLPLEWPFETEPAVIQLREAAPKQPAWESPMLIDSTRPLPVKPERRLPYFLAYRSLFTH